MTDIIAELNRVELLAGMGKELLSQIAAVVVTKTLEPDETLVEEGSIGEDLYFVRSGSLLVTVMDGLKSTEVARLGPGGMDCYLCDSQSDESRLIAVNEGIHLHGDPVKDKELLQQLSPIHKVDQVTALTIVLHGANDTNVPVVEAEQVVKSLEDRGVPVKYVLFPDEGHGWRKTENRITSDVEIVRWFESNL